MGMRRDMRAAIRRHRLRCEAPNNPHPGDVYACCKNDCVRVAVRSLAMELDPKGYSWVQYRFELHRTPIFTVPLRDFLLLYPRLRERGGRRVKTV